MLTNLSGGKIVQAAHSTLPWQFGGEDVEGVALLTPQDTTSTLNSNISLTDNVACCCPRRGFINFRIVGLIMKKVHTVLTPRELYLYLQQCEFLKSPSLWVDTPLFSQRL